MLIREIREVRTLIKDIQGKIANVDLEEELKKIEKNK